MPISKYYITSLIIFLVLSHTSCKQKTDEQKTEINLIHQFADGLISINHSNEGNDKEQKNYTINFSTDRNTLSIWRYYFDVEDGSIRDFAQLTNENLAFLGETKDKAYHYEPFLLILDKDGKLIKREDISTPQYTKYETYNSFLVDQKEKGCVLYLLKKSQEDATKIEKIRFTPDAQLIESIEKKVTDIFPEKNVSEQDIHLELIDNRIISYGEIPKGDGYSTPFISTLDSDLNLINFNNFSEYESTSIRNISTTKDGNFYIEGIKNEAMDGSYYFTHIRFELSKDLIKIKDFSDKEPFHSEYRGPSSPDYEEGYEDESDIQEETKVEETTENTIEEESWSSHKMHTDIDSDISYAIKEKHINSNEIIFEKTDNSNKSVLWNIHLNFPSSYEVPYHNSSKGLLRANGDFIFFLYLRDKTKKHSEQSALIFIFDKNGYLKQQFQTQSYFTITSFELHELDNQLITTYTSHDAVLRNNNWIYPHTIHVEAYELK